MNEALAVSLPILLVLAFFAYVLRLRFKSTDDMSDRHARQRKATIDQMIELRRASRPTWCMPSKDAETPEEAEQRVKDEQRAEELGMRFGPEVVTRPLCESKSVMLRPGQKYLFLPVDGCRTCAAMMREARSAYLGDGE